ncbi:hypothetical protein BVRB_3g063840 [Beta vulgaris subsp. vulgaris]|nr:hypothetical protein BVRB_3g063840 [Beta vulgaris subsp. vulgaris]
MEATIDITKGFNMLNLSSHVTISRMSVPTVRTFLLMLYLQNQSSNQNRSAASSGYQPSLTVGQ